MTAWVLQGNPDRFDIDAYVRAGRAVLWTVRKNAKQMRPGDTVYFWRAAGRRGTGRGVVAVGEITESGRIREDDPAAAGLWRTPPAPGPKLRVGVMVQSDAVGRGGALSAAEIKAAPGLAGLGPLRFANATSFRLAEEEASRLSGLWQVTSSAATPQARLRLRDLAGLADALHMGKH